MCFITVRLLICNSFCGYFIKAGDNENVAHWFDCAFEALVKDYYGYEVIVREKLSRICLFLCREYNPQTDTPDIL